MWDTSDIFYFGKCGLTLALLHVNMVVVCLIMPLLYSVIRKYRNIILNLRQISDNNNLQPLEAVSRGSETQLQVTEEFNLDI